MLWTWKTVTSAQRRESKFFLSQFPVLGSQNLQPNKFIPRILKMNMNNMRRPKKTATLSMVFSITISDLWRLGRNLNLLILV